MTRVLDTFTGSALLTGPLGRCAARLAGLALAVVIVAFDGPAWLRLSAAAPILLWISGDTLLRLVLGNAKEKPTDDPEDPDTSPLASGWVVPMALLIGVLVALSTALLLATFGFGLHMRGILTAITAVGAAGSVGVWWIERSGDVPPRPGFWRLIGPKQVVAVALSALVMVGAINLAKSFYDVTPETHFALSRFVDKSMLTDAVTAKPGTNVQLRWQVQSFGWVPPESDFPVMITVGDAAGLAPLTSQVNTTPVGVGDEINDLPGESADNAREITATIRAPRRPATYLVRIVTTLPNGDTTELTTHLKVAR